MIAAEMDRIQKVPDLPELEQTIRLVFRYSTDFCLESFSANQSLALMSNGSEQEAKVTLTPQGRMNLPEVRIQPRDVEPVQASNRFTTWRLRW